MLRTTLVLGLLLAGCGGGAGDGEPVAVFDVAWTDRARLVEESQGRALLLGDAPGPETLTYRFRKEASAIAALQPGDVAVLAGIAYRKVVAVNDTGDALELVTERTTLPAAIRSGTIEWDQPVDFTDLATTQGMLVEAGDVPLARVSGALEYTGEVDGYDVSVTLTPGAGRLDVSASVSKEVLGEKRFAVDAEGYVRGFRAAGRITLDEAGDVTMESGQRELEGELKVKAAAFNTGASQDLLSIPLGLSFPIQVGPVPLMLKIKAHVNVTLELAIADSSAEAEVTFKFRSDQGIQVAGSRMSADASLQQGDLSGFLGGAADYVAAGMNTCLEFPRVELSMLGEFASVAVTQNNCASTVFTFDPACNQVRGTLTGIALASLGFFGVTLASGQVELYKREGERHVGNCGE